MPPTTSTSPKSPRFPQLDGFQPLNAPSTNSNMSNLRPAGGGGSGGGAAMEDIPLEKVVTHGSVTGARKPSSATGIPPPSLHGGDAEKGGGGANKLRKTIGRRRKSKLEQNAGSIPKAEGEQDGALNRMGRIYLKILNFSVVTRYFIFVLPLAALLAVPIAVGLTAAPGAKIGGVRMVWFFVWLEIVWLSLWVSKIFAHFLPKLFQFLAGVVSPGVRKYALVLKALEIPLSLVGWAVASLLTFTPLMLRNPDTQREAETDEAARDLRSWQAVLRQILGAALVCTLIFLGERLLIQLISINYHRQQFDDKIKDNKRSVYLLGLLYDASRSLFPEYCEEFAHEDYIINDALNLSGIGGNGNGRSGKGSGTATPMRLLHNVGRIGDKVTAAFGNVASEITGKRVFDSESAHSIVVDALEKTRSCEALARRLWMSFVCEGRDALFQDDVVEVLGPQRRLEAEESFASLDRDGNGDISLDEMILTVTEIGRTRKSLASSMHDVDQAIHVLDGLLSTVVFVISIFVFVAFLNRNFSTTLATAGTALLSMSFVFAATTQEVLGSCIFLFVKHPFDIGDRVDIKSEQMTVERISLLYTVFKHTGTGKIVQIPNIVLNGLWVENITRSKAMRERIPIFVNFETTFDDIRTLKDEMEKFVSDKDNNRDFLPGIDIDVIGIAEMNKLELAIDIKHKSNWANESIRAARRSKFMCALVLALRRVPIYGPGAGDAALGSHGAPSYSVAISPEQAQDQKDEFAKKKEGKRLHPTPPADPEPEPDAEHDGPGGNNNTKSSAAGPPSIPVPSNLFSSSSSTTATGASAGASFTTGTEYRALQSLTQRNPAADPTRDAAFADRDDVAEFNDSSGIAEGRPSTTAGDRVGRASLDEVRGLLRQESERGRRVAGEGAGGGNNGGALLRGPPVGVSYAVPPGQGGLSGQSGYGAQGGSAYQGYQGNGNAFARR